MATVNTILMKKCGNMFIDDYNLLAEIKEKGDVRIRDKGRILVVALEITLS